MPTAVRIMKISKTFSGWCPFKIYSANHSSSKLTLKIQLLSLQHLLFLNYIHVVKCLMTSYLFVVLSLCLIGIVEWSPLCIMNLCLNTSVGIIQIFET